MRVGCARRMDMPTRRGVHRCRPRVDRAEVCGQRGGLCSHHRAAAASTRHLVAGGGQAAVRGPPDRCEKKVLGRLVETAGTSASARQGRCEVRGARREVRGGARREAPPFTLPADPAPACLPSPRDKLLLTVLRTVLAGRRRAAAPLAAAPRSPPWPRLVGRRAQAAPARPRGPEGRLPQGPLSARRVCRLWPYDCCP